MCKSGSKNSSLCLGALGVKCAKISVTAALISYGHACPNQLSIDGMIFGPSFGGLGRLSRNVSRSALLLSLVIQALPATSIAALPKRLVIALDGIAYCDMKALQEGVTYKDTHGIQFHRQGFHQGYFLVSPMRLN